MKLRLSFLAPFAISLALLTGCDSGPTECTDPDTAGCMVTSGAQRVQSPNVPQKDLDALVQGNTEFALSLHQALRGEPGNIFYSPHSITSALAMTWAGARNQTETDIAKAMHFTLPQAQFHPAMNQLGQLLDSRGEDAKAADGGPMRLDVPNAIWGQMGASYETKFLDTLAVNYGAGMHIVDFAAPQDATDAINGWVDERTEGKIPELFDPGVITSDTRLVLTNCIYFNGAWAHPFEESLTRDGEFHRLDGSTVTVPMMYGTPSGKYYDGEDFDAVALPYDKNELSLLVLVPDSGKFDSVESSLDSSVLSEVVKSLEAADVELNMPKFKATSKFSLTDVLDGLGMGVAFTSEADFSGINGKGGLQISDVVHQAYVDVSEKGTEAAAATGTGFEVTSAPFGVTVTIDRPFLMFLRDDATGAILFAGRIQDPSKQ